MHDQVIAAIDARPKNFGVLCGANAHAKIKGPCGDTVEVWLDIGNEKIQKASFVSDGCGYSVHCCSTAVKLAEGLRLAEAEQLRPDDVLKAVGPVPSDHHHCALLAINTTREAIAAYYKTPAPQPFWRRFQKMFKRPDQP